MSLRSCLILLTLSTSATTTAQNPERAPLIVHEWGTFTSMSGSDGIVLEGLQHEEERLPEFVHELAELESVHGGRGHKALKFPATRVTQKMETPVIYFHTDVPREVTVRVRFPDGILTQFYPIPMFVSPALDRQLRTPIDLGDIRRSELIWDVELIPFGARAPREIPRCDPEDSWSFARDVRSAYVRTNDPDGVQRATEAEHYLFYRGLARFALPFKLQTIDAGVRGFTNGSKHRVPFAAALEMTEDGGRFVELGAIEAGDSLSFSLDNMRLDLDRQGVAAALGARVFDALVREGLFEDEARAMIATWSRSWFQSDGVRVIYVLPRAEVDRVLPLTIHPKPDRIVRVLVGRLEHITRNAERAVEAALTDRLSNDAGTRTEAREYLDRLDRFLEPHVRRALARSHSELVKRSAREVLAELTRAPDAQR